MNHIQADYVRIILMEANAECSPLDIGGLEILMHACITRSMGVIETQAEERRLGPAARAARFILRKHKFATARQASILETEHGKA